jgi:hypothetical protein
LTLHAACQSKPPIFRYVSLSKEFNTELRCPKPDSRGCSQMLRLVLFGLLAAPLTAGGPDKLVLQWTELSAWTQADARVRITLAGGERLEGRILEVSADGLNLLVLQRNTERRIDRAAVKTMELRRDISRARWKGFQVGAGIGAAAGVFGGMMSDRVPGGNRAIGTTVAVASGIAFYGGIGYLWGRSIDRTWTPVEFR